jgi:hypothetical protein
MKNVEFKLKIGFQILQISLIVLCYKFYIFFENFPKITEIPEFN